MSKITDSIILAGLENKISQGANSNATGLDFDTLLLNGGGNQLLAGDLLNNIINAASDIGAIMTAGMPAAKFPFTPDFTIIFGTTGPLPAYINIMTAKLHLSAAKNRAFQTIAVANKDITNTPKNISKLMAELKAAGIGYSNIP